MLKYHLLFASKKFPSTPPVQVDDHLTRSEITKKEKGAIKKSEVQLNSQVEQNL